MEWMMRLSNYEIEQLKIVNMCFYYELHNLGRIWCISNWLAFNAGPLWLGESQDSDYD